MQKLLVAMSLALTGCAVAPPPPRLLAPADTRARVPVLNAPTANAGTMTFRPVGPKGWEDINNGIADKQKGAAP